MSIGPMNPIAVSVAGSAFATNRGAETERAEQDATSQETQVYGAEKAESASDVGETDGQDSHASERDADGRRAWEFRRGKSSRSAGDAAGSHLPKDPSGLCGNELDLSG